MGLDVRFANFIKRRREMKYKLTMAFVVCIVFCGGMIAQAAIVMSDGNSTVTVDPNVQPNMYNWIVDGQNNLFEQDFWYAFDGLAQQSLNTLAQPSYLQPLSNILTVSYVGNGLTVNVLYSLVGGTPGSHRSDIAETISIINTSGSAQRIRFYQYVDFDLNGTPGNDYVVFPNLQRVQQYEPGAIMSETIVTPAPSDYEGNTFPNTLLGLSSGVMYPLNNAPGIGVPLGPGDVTWAYEWDQIIPANGILLISKDKSIAPIVPEAASIIIWFGLSSMFVMRVWRRRRIAVPATPSRRLQWSDESRIAIHQMIERGYRH
jgi:hypothetical protein